jgi:hypothetical protein
MKLRASRILSAANEPAGMAHRVELDPEDA